MTREQAKAYLPFVQAAAKGKTVQWRSRFDNTWNDCNAITPITGSPADALRIKPASSLRKWKHTEVPVGKLLFGKCWDKRAAGPSLILGACMHGVRFFEESGDATATIRTFDELLADYLWSEDCVNWKPCGVEE